MSTAYESAKSIAQTLIRTDRAAPLTREGIASVVDRVVLMLGSTLGGEVDRDRLVRDLEALFSVWIGVSRSLDNNEGHVAWLPNRKGSITWQYWNRYRELLKGKLAPDSLDRLDEITDDILQRLEDPARSDAWDRRGLVVGHVQSGKTANYIGLICKAADAGYKLIVVLAGAHSSLRSQTQVRLDEGFLGYEALSAVDSARFTPTGVGLIDPSLRPDTITTRHEDGDFKRSVANHFNINPGGRPLLFVIKKNGAVLRNLLDWVDWAANSHDAETRRKVVRGVPLLVIDDEADYASVDTREQEYANGTPDEEHDPTVINRRIRTLLRYFEKSAYVGYTATPFANIFIHERGRTAEEGDDLFPASFITNLPAPSDYIGPVRVFGLDPDPALGTDGSPGLPLVRHIADQLDEVDQAQGDNDPDGPVRGWMPPRHDKNHQPRYGGRREIPPSLREAVHAFILACAARRARRQLNEHSSMLVHVTRFTDVQGEVAEQLKDEVRAIESRLRNGDGDTPDGLMATLSGLWERDFLRTTASINDPTTEPTAWAQVALHLLDVVAAIQVKQVNGSAGDLLEYERHRTTGLTVIAVGGDKLSRGLTLEGLTVSYFLRASRMYDTLMQMGRWFGYRPGYLDLCRLYMTSDLEHWFRHITTASEELRQEFDHMAAVGGTPREYGLKVRSHPVLLVTSPVKMRHNTEVQLSFAGSISETTVLHRDKATIEKNFLILEGLIRSMGVPTEVSPTRERSDGQFSWRSTLLWSGIGAPVISSFLSRIETHERALKVNGRLMSEFIDKQARGGELTSWTVALLSRFDAAEKEVIAGHEIGLFTRKFSGDDEATADRYIMKRLVSPRDEAIDLGREAYEEALRRTREAFTKDAGRSSRTAPPDVPSGPMIRGVRPQTNGLLLLYPLDPASWNRIEGELPPLGFAVSFPASNTATRVTYRVNNVYSQQEFGAIP